MKNPFYDIQVSPQEQKEEFFNRKVNQERLFTKTKLMHFNSILFDLSKHFFI